MTPSAATINARMAQIQSPLGSAATGCSGCSREAGNCGQRGSIAALIAAAQREEHYEMAGYGCVRTFAKLLGYEDAATLLQETLMRRGKRTRTGGL